MTQIPSLFQSKKKFPKQTKKVKSLTQSEAQFLIDNIKITIKDIQQANAELTAFIENAWEYAIPDGSSKSEEAFKSLNEAREQQREVRALLNKFSAIQHKLKTQR